MQLLQQLHDKITRKLSPAKSVDPLTVLPVELAEMVLEQIAFRHLVNCMRVSRGWHNYVAKLPRLWTHLDLSGARRPVSRKFVDKAVRYSENKLRRVTVYRLEHFDILRNIARACKSLTELEFISLPHAMSSTLVDIVQTASKLEKIVVHPQITMDTMGRIINTKPTLRHVAFYDVKASNHTLEWKCPTYDLESCRVHLDRNIPYNASLMDSLRLTPKLEHLEMGNVLVDRPLPETLPLTTLVLRKAGFVMFPILPGTLKKLVLDCDWPDQPPHFQAAISRARLPALTHLQITGMHDLSDTDMHKLLDLWVAPEDDSIHLPIGNATPLESITIRTLLEEDASLFLSPDSLFLGSPRILTPALKHIDIATMPCNDDEIEALLKHKTGLTSIDLSQTQVTGASIKMLVDRLPTLKLIRADNCTRISGRDAIEYAARKGVAVTCSMGEGKGGKKVRYG
jgi:F-box/TPR repeat protein Pof3